MASAVGLTTKRLRIEPPGEQHREPLVKLFADPAFMVFAGICDPDQANRRFDRMLSNAALVPFTKRPIVERSSGEVLGYAGVAPFELEGESRLEFGYRLSTQARGRGYATEAGLALIKCAREHWSGILLAMIDPTNAPSINVIEKLGFDFWKQYQVEGDDTNLYQLDVRS